MSASNVPARSHRHPRPRKPELRLAGSKLGSIPMSYLPEELPPAVLYGLLCEDDIPELERRRTLFAARRLLRKARGT